MEAVCHNITGYFIVLDQYAGWDFLR